MPHGVICLLSALQFHEITTQMPMETWIAIERSQAIPKSKDYSIRIIRLSQVYFASGIEEHHLPGSTIRVYSSAKTVVDCFKFRNKIGIDIAREALRDSLAQGKATVAAKHSGPPAFVSWVSFPMPLADPPDLQPQYGSQSSVQ